MRFPPSKLAVAFLLIWTGFMLQCGSSFHPQAQTDAPAQTAGTGGVNRVQEFFTTATWTVPPNITRVMAEMWGAGGSSSCLPVGTPEPSGGGGGAYTRTVFAVSPGEMLSIVVGTGGVSDVNGGDASDTQILRGSTIVTFAGGGHGGTGSGGAGGNADPNADISHAGFPGSFDNTVGYGRGYPYAFNLAPAYQNPANFGWGYPAQAGFGFSGIGFGGIPCIAGGISPGGGPGYVLLSW